MPKYLQTFEDALRVEDLHCNFGDEIYAEKREVGVSLDYVVTDWRQCIKGK